MRKLRGTAFSDPLSDGKPPQIRIAFQTRHSLSVARFSVVPKIVTNF